MRQMQWIPESSAKRPHLMWPLLLNKNSQQHGQNKKPSTTFVINQVLFTFVKDFINRPRGHKEQTMIPITPEYLRPRLLHRDNDSHKHDYGRLLIVAGCETMPGAAILSTGAALRSGCGLVRLHSTVRTLFAAASRYPSAMLSEDPGTTSAPFRRILADIRPSPSARAWDVRREP